MEWLEAANRYTWQAVVVATVVWGVVRARLGLLAWRIRRAERRRLHGGAPE